MEWIERYLDQVGRRLPKRLRADVTAELRSLLIDTLEERTGRNAADRVEFSEADQLAVLKEFGPPAHMAAQYRPQPQYIIGPKVYNLYLIVVAAVIGAGLLATIVSTAVANFHTASVGTAVLSSLVQGWSRFVSIALSGIGSTTLVFAVLERVIPDDRLKLDDEGEWNPRDLPEIEERDEINPAGLIAQIGILALLLVAFVGFPGRIGTGAYYDGEWHVVPSILSATFFSTYLPVIATRWVMTIVLNLVLLRQGRWQKGTRIADFLLDVCDILILAWLVLGPSIVDVDVLRSMLPAMADVPLQPLVGGIRLAFLVALVVLGIQTAVRLYHLVQSKWAARQAG